MRKRQYKTEVSEIQKQAKVTPTNSLNHKIIVECKSIRLRNNIYRPKKKKKKDNLAPNLVDEDGNVKFTPKLSLTMSCTTSQICDFRKKKARHFFLRILARNSILSAKVISAVFTDIRTTLAALICGKENLKSTIFCGSSHAFSKLTNFDELRRYEELWI